MSDPETVLRCPRCHGTLTHLRDEPTRISLLADTRFASRLFRCPQGDLWRVYVNGKIEPIHH